MKEWIILLAATGASNAAMWSSYVYHNRNGFQQQDWGGVPESLRSYLLISAVVAIACNLIFVGVLSSVTEDRNTLLLASACVALYYGLQVLFFPLVRQRRRMALRVLLFACAIPTIVLAGIGIRLKHATLGVLGTLFALHVTVNDAVVYGFLF